MTAMLMEAGLVVCVGPGGVGKTSVAAALALMAARAGRRTCVLTVDPARRLASALGIGLANVPTRVPLQAQGELWAAMLDAPASFAAMIERIAPNAALRDRVFEHPMYRAGAGGLSRSHAYAAMEWLHEVFAHGGYDLVVLDTPPASVGVEMFDAPARLLALLDPKVLGWLLGKGGGGVAGRVMAGGGAIARRAAQALLGEGPWADILDFLGLLLVLQPAIVERSNAMSARLRQADTRFVLVCRTDAPALDDLGQIADALAERSLPVGHAVWNRVPEAIDDPGALDVDAALASLGLDSADDAAVLRAARTARREAARIAARARTAAAQFARSRRIVHTAWVPELETTGGLDDLERIAGLLDFAGG